MPPINEVYYVKYENRFDEAVYIEEGTSFPSPTDLRNSIGNNDNHMSRLNVWNHVHSGKMPITYQPEDDGYFIVKIIKGIHISQ